MELGDGLGVGTDGGDGGDFHGCLVVQGRQHRRQPFGEHRLSRSGGTDEHHVVPSGGGHLESEPGFVLTADLSQVLLRRRGSRTFSRDAGSRNDALQALPLLVRRRRDVGCSVGGGDLVDMVGSQNLYPRHQCGFGSVVGGHHDGPHTGTSSRSRCRQDASDRSQPAVQAQLSQEDDLVSSGEVPVSGPGTDQDG